eukprot:6587493-Heterocapsa_arctica.AAC.1
MLAGLSRTELVSGSGMRSRSTRDGPGRKPAAVGPSPGLEEHADDRRPSQAAGGKVLNTTVPRQPSAARP